MKDILRSLSLLVIGVSLASLVGVVFFGGGDDQSHAESIARQATVIVTLSLGLALMERTATAAADFRRCVITWFVFVAANALLLFLGIVGAIPLWFGVFPGASLRSIGWYPRGPDAPFLGGITLWALSGFLVVWLGVQGANLTRHAFLPTRDRR